MVVHDEERERIVGIHSNDMLGKTEVLAGKASRMQ
jgi:hypothetical protein